MSNELIAIIGVGVTLAGIILYSQHNMRSEMRAEFKTVRAGTQAEFRAVRAETQAEFKIHLEAINQLRDDVNQLQAHLAHQEGLLEGLREAITGSRELAISGHP